MEGSAKHSQQLYAEFQTGRSELLSRLPSEGSTSSQLDKSTLQSLQEDLAKLRKQLTDATPYLPTYDQRTCEKQIAEIEQSIEKYRSVLEPRSKFTFKRKVASPSQKVLSPNTPDLQPKQSISPVVITSSETAISSRNGEYLTLPDTDASSSGINISKLDGCIVDLICSLPRSTETNDDSKFLKSSVRPLIQAIQIRDVKNSILCLGPVSGSVLLHDLERCIVIVSCHQLRLHTSTRTNLYIFTSSNPIIEDCSGIGVTDYPLQFPLPEEFRQGSTSKHLSVLDFSHIKDTPSPNWAVLQSESVADADIANSLHSFCMDKQDQQGRLKILLDKLLP